MGCLTEKREPLASARALRILAGAIAPATAPGSSQARQGPKPPGQRPPGRALACRCAGGTGLCRKVTQGRGKRGSRFLTAPRRATPVPGSGRSSRQACGRIAVSAPCQGMVRVNLQGTVSVVTKAAARIMVLDLIGPHGERGVIIITASITTYEGQGGQGTYVASKGAIAAMTIRAARECAFKVLRVLAIAPGLCNPHGCKGAAGRGRSRHE
ncbi:MAG: SDR family NAD(P)-dependent oxidoreductase [Cereibacter sp.]